MTHKLITEEKNPFEFEVRKTWDEIRAKSAQSGADPKTLELCDRALQVMTHWSAKADVQRTLDVDDDALTRCFKVSPSILRPILRQWTHQVKDLSRPNLASLLGALLSGANDGPSPISSASSIEEVEDSLGDAASKLPEDVREQVQSAIADGQPVRVMKLDLDTLRQRGLEASPHPWAQFCQRYFSFFDNMVDSALLIAELPHYAQSANEIAAAQNKPRKCIDFPASALLQIVGLIASTDYVTHGGKGVCTSTAFMESCLLHDAADASYLSNFPDKTNTPLEVVIDWFKEHSVSDGTIEMLRQLKSQEPEDAEADESTPSAGSWTTPFSSNGHIH